MRYGNKLAKMCFENRLGKKIDFAIYVQFVAQEHTATATYLPSPLIPPLGPRELIGPSRDCQAQSAYSTSAAPYSSPFSSNRRHRQGEKGPAQDMASAFEEAQE